jgi:hypothetical protein
MAFSEFFRQKAIFRLIIGDCLRYYIKRRQSPFY